MLIPPRGGLLHSLSISSFYFMHVVVSFILLVISFILLVVWFFLVVVLLLRGCDSSSSWLWFFFFFHFLRALWFFFFLHFLRRCGSSSFSFLGTGCCCFVCYLYWLDVVVLYVIYIGLMLLFEAMSQTKMTFSWKNSIWMINPYDFFLFCWMIFFNFLIC